jgi:tetratricopeptide (TPR) repeat protein
MTITKSAVELKKIGIGFLDNQIYHQAIDFLSRSILLDKNDPESFDLRGVAFFRIFKIDNAISDLKTAIQIDPEYYFAYAHLGEIVTGMEDFNAAEGYYEEALKLNAVSIEYLSFLALAKSRLRKLDEALALCNTILKIEPKDAWTLGLAGETYIDKKMYREALNCFVPLLEIEPSNTDNFNHYQYLGYIYSKLGIMDLARKNLDIAMHLNPDHAYSYNNLGYIFYTEKNYTEALRLINQSLTLDASNAYAYKNRALVHLDKKDIEKAKEDLYMAKELGFTDLYGDEVDELLRSVDQLVNQA